MENTSNDEAEQKATADAEQKAQRATRAPKKQPRSRRQTRPRPVPGAPVFLNPDDAAAALGVRRTKLLELEQAGRLRAARLGPLTIRYLASDLAKLVEEGATS